MNLSVERDDDRLVVGSEERNHTVLNLIKQAVWDVGGQAGYDRGHPYRGESKLVVTADDPDETLEDAIEKVQDDVETFIDTFDDA
jgi:DNA-directed RNA polymerase subunit L